MMMKKSYYKVSVFDWKAKNYKGGWVVKACCLRTRAEAKRMVEDYTREGTLARHSKHTGGGFFYE